MGDKTRPGGSKGPENSRDNPSELTMRHQKGEQYNGFLGSQGKPGRLVGWIRRPQEGGPS